ncbi:MAG TPA: hypothetical protein DEQ30_10900, partial [Porphyromonadaceae bacterium]|nr:hypothetical protein [Porphyromonadaceae bacterium]
MLKKGFSAPEKCNNGPFYLFQTKITHTRFIIFRYVVGIIIEKVLSLRVKIYISTIFYELKNKTMKTSYPGKIFLTALLCAVSWLAYSLNPRLTVCTDDIAANRALPRSTPAAENVNAAGITNFLDAVKKSGQDLHSLMIVRNGKVVSEQWLGDNAADKPHVMFSVSKTYTATAIGFAVAEGRLKVTDKVT